jgi:hypothetical protein
MIDPIFTESLNTDHMEAVFTVYDWGVNVRLWTDIAGEYSSLLSFFRRRMFGGYVL